MGPTAVNALMTYNYVGSLNTNIIDAALTLGFFSGLIEIGTGILNLGISIQSDILFIHLKIYERRLVMKCLISLFLISGFLTNFISAPVIAAFTSAVSINVMTSQIKGLLGLKKVSTLSSNSVYWFLIDF